MAEIFGHSGRGLAERIGSLAQMVRVDSFTETEGAARGTRRLRLVNGGGIELELHPDRALDLGQMTVDGVPIAWVSPSGPVAPQFYEASGTNWLRTFGGGLLATCGLDSFGPASEDAGASFGLHGRIGAQPARVTRAEASAEGVVVEASARQTTVFGENLMLRRRVSSEAGSDTVIVADTVTNDGFAPAPHMMLYHINLGWPLLDETTTLSLPDGECHPRDPDAVAGAADWARMGPPTEGWREQVFRHDLPPSRPVNATITNRKLGIELSIGFDSARLPVLYQWKMLGQGHYVLGVEPSNCRNIFGRAAARAAGDLPFLEAGETVGYEIVFRIRRTKGASDKP
jgi:hypothetical protein